MISWTPWTSRNLAWTRRGEYTTASEHCYSLLTIAYRNPAEYAALDDLYSPIIHRVNEVIRARAVDETGSIEKIPAVLLKYAHPPEALVRKAQPTIDKLIKAADVKFKEGQSLISFSIH